MPAPKRPNTAAATEASVAARRRAADERLAAQLYSRGWLLMAPENAEEIRRGATISLDNEWYPKATND